MTCLPVSGPWLGAPARLFLVDTSQRVYSGREICPNWAASEVVEENSLP